MPQVLPRPVATVQLPADASYLLVGGLGGIGRSISRWMASHGARNFIFVSRSGAAAPAAAQLVADLEKIGARVEVLKCDATDSEKLSAAVGTALKSLPPLRGIIQGAMVLQDGLFESMSYERWTTSLRPKVQGTWALHNVAKELSAPLDFFVMLSSSAAFIGNAGQSNYVSGNTFQTALARFRRQQGLPAVALDFGKVAEIGVVAENAGGASDSNLDRLGLPGITEAEVLSLVEMAIIADSQLDVQPTTLEDGENSHIVTGVIDLIKPESGERDMPFWGRDPVFNHMEYVRPRPDSGNDGEDGSAKANTISLRDVVSSRDSIDDEKMLVDVLSALTTKLAKALMLVAADVDHGKSPSDLGADSLVGVELRNFLAREASVDLPVFDILGSSSLKTIAKNVSKLIRGQGK
jgi:NADP-dependent 3-hydroxy acid dehydrogenase YdfG